MKKYSIGEVSSHLGLSRDTLRFYEKKGIIAPEKLNNGYRSYSHDDIRKLLSIRFYRRLNFSLEDIDQILHQGSLHTCKSMVQEKIMEEKSQVEKHRQSLVHLNHLQQLYKNVEECLNQYDLRPLPSFYRLDDNQFMNETGISDLCYLSHEYCFKDSKPLQTGQLYMLSSDTAAIMKIKESLSDCPLIQYERCIYTVTAATNPVEEIKALGAAAKWAQEQDYSMQGNAFSRSLLSSAFHQTAAPPIQYTEIYLPITENAL